MSLIEMMVKQIEMVWSSTLRGDQGERSRQHFAVMRAPAKIDDLVLIGTVHPKTPAENRLGWLVNVEDAPVQPWDGDEPAPLCRYWTIERLSDGKPFRWTNVQVLRVVHETRYDHIEPIVRPVDRSGH